MQRWCRDGVGVVQGWCRDAGMEQEWGAGTPSPSAPTCTAPLWAFIAMKCCGRGGSAWLVVTLLGPCGPAAPAVQGQDVGLGLGSGRTGTLGFPKAVCEVQGEAE